MIPRSLAAFFTILLVAQIITTILGLTPADKTSVVILDVTLLFAILNLSLRGRM